MVWIEFALILGLILFGSRLKGIGLGVMGGIGMILLVFGFHLKPVSPPVDVMLIILSVITAAATLQTAGGLDLLVSWAAALLRKNPGKITFTAPFVTYFFTLFAGTAHINYSLLPVISEVALKRRVRPERPLSISVIASHLAITGSPVGAATAAMVAMMSPQGFELNDILFICIPSGLIGTALGTIVASFMGKNLDQDPEFQKRLADPEFAASINQTHQKELDSNQKSKGLISVIVFAIAVLAIIFFGSFPQFRPIFPDKEGVLTPVKSPEIIEMMMLSAAALMLIFTGSKAREVVKGSIFKAGSEAVVCIFGVVWMSDTFLQGNEAFFKNNLGDLVSNYPWTFALALFAFSALVFSQTAAVRALVPLAISIGIPGQLLIAMFPAANGDFFIPGYPTLLAAIGFDRSGSTKIGKFLLNHSFMLPGIAGVGGAVLAGLGIVYLFY